MEDGTHVGRIGNKEVCEQHVMVVVAEEGTDAFLVSGEKDSRDDVERTIQKL